MREAVIVDAVRTPFGARDGVFADLHPQDLAAEPLLALEERLGFDPGRTIEDVVYGCVSPIDEQGGNVGRLAPLVAGWGDAVPGVQLNRMCGSGQQAINFAAGAIATGAHDAIVAGGVEHMSRVPMGSDFGGVTETYFEHYDELVQQGESAERIAEQWGFDRRELDELAVESQRRWKQAWDDGRYESQIAPVRVEAATEDAGEDESEGETRVVDTDEHPRPESTVEDLANLPLAFRQAGDGVIHAGNSSGIVDGASAVLVTSREAAEEHGWEPMARIVQTEVVGVDPVTMLTGPIPATEGVLEKTDLTIDDVDRFEVNEAFASVVAAWLEEADAPPDDLWERTNVNGGAIAHGHPLGATGAALVTKLVHELERTGQDVGLSTMCIGFGQGIATIVERV